MSEQDQKVVSIDKNKEVALHMTIEAAQYVMTALGERPYNEVRVLLNSFDQQLTRQVMPQEVPTSGEFKEGNVPSDFDEAVGE